MTTAFWALCACVGISCWATRGCHWSNGQDGFDYLGSNAYVIKTLPLDGGISTNLHIEGLERSCLDG